MTVILLNDCPKYYKFEVENKLKSIALSVEYYLESYKNKTTLDFNKVSKDFAIFIIKSK